MVMGSKMAGVENATDNTICVMSKINVVLVFGWIVGIFSFQQNLLANSLNLNSIFYRWFFHSTKIKILFPVFSAKISFYMATSTQGN